MISLDGADFADFIFIGPSVRASQPEVFRLDRWFYVSFS